MRDKVIEKIFNLGCELSKKWSRETYNKMFSLADAWNEEHPEHEIMVCDAGDRIYVEDDYFLYSE